MKKCEQSFLSIYTGANSEATKGSLLVGSHICHSVTVNISACTHLCVHKCGFASTLDAVASFPVLHHSYRRLQYVLQATIAVVEDWERG